MERGLAVVLFGLPVLGSTHRRRQTERQRSVGNGGNHSLCHFLPPPPLLYTARAARDPTLYCSGIDLPASDSDSDVKVCLYGGYFLSPLGPIHCR